MSKSECWVPNEGVCEMTYVSLNIFMGKTSSYLQGKIISTRRLPYFWLCHCLKDLVMLGELAVGSGCNPQVAEVFLC